MEEDKESIPSDKSLKVLQRLPRRLRDTTKSTWKTGASSFNVMGARALEKALPRRTDWYVLLHILPRRPPYRDDRPVEEHAVEAPPV